MKLVDALVGASAHRYGRQGSPWQGQPSALVQMSLRLTNHARALDSRVLTWAQGAAIIPHLSAFPPRTTETASSFPARVDAAPAPPAADFQALELPVFSAIPNDPPAVEAEVPAKPLLWRANDSYFPRSPSPPTAPPLAPAASRNFPHLGLGHEDPPVLFFAKASERSSEARSERLGLAGGIWSPTEAADVVDKVLAPMHVR